MRVFAAAFALALAACTPPAQPAATPQDASAGSSGVGRIPEAPFTLESEAVVGLWSFARDCGLYDLVLNADGTASYYDYSGDLVVSHQGAWATADNNRVVLTVRRLDASGAPTAPAIVYNVDVAAPVTDDLVGRFARSDGGEARDITARRCPEEDRD
jgi:hypothetical protein